MRCFLEDTTLEVTSCPTLSRADPTLVPWMRDTLWPEQVDREISATDDSHYSEQRYSGESRGSVAHNAESPGSRCVNQMKLWSVTLILMNRRPMIKLMSCGIFNLVSPPSIVVADVDSESLECARCSTAGTRRRHPAHPRQASERDPKVKGPYHLRLWRVREAHCRFAGNFI